ncbi:hypothetical protein GCM10011576_01420 [Micromonospora parathelypteridis]|nr:hypothetical protein GCM10011576_01420 [Micromonospora parathelypteridis]
MRGGGRGGQGHGRGSDQHRGEEPVNGHEGDLRPLVRPAGGKGSTAVGGNPAGGCGVSILGTARTEEADMKVRSSLRALKQKPGSVVVRRRGRVVVVNRANPQWKSRQG